jgi:hypothetical protein
VSSAKHLFVSLAVSRDLIDEPCGIFCLRHPSTPHQHHQPQEGHLRPPPDRDRLIQ